MTAAPASYLVNDAELALCQLETPTPLHNDYHFAIKWESLSTIRGCRTMQAVDITTATHLVQSQTITRAIIECFDGRRWCVVLRGRQEFVLRSKRQNPKSFAKVETALEEIKGLGLRHAEVNMEKWDTNQNTIA